jgi:hypothetical protein
MGNELLCKQRIDTLRDGAAYPIDVAVEVDASWRFFYTDILQGMRQ